MQALTRPLLPVFIGVDAATWLPARVLVCSMCRRCTTGLDIKPLVHTEHQDKAPLRHQLAWLVPELCQYRGLAAYLEPTLVLRCNLLAQFRQIVAASVMPGLGLWYAQPQIIEASHTGDVRGAVSFFDCAAVPRWSLPLPAGVLVPEAPSALLSVAWTRPDAGTNTLAIYYERPREQPWLVPDHPRARWWQHELQIALSLGYVTSTEFEEALAAYHPDQEAGLHPYYDRYRKLLSNLCHERTRRRK